MTLFIYKWLIAAVIAIITLTVGLASLKFIRRFQHLLSLGDAFADGIFLGVAAFHLFPDALNEFTVYHHLLTAYLFTLILVIGGFCLLLLLERIMLRREMQRATISNAAACTASAWMLVGILAVHAFIAGAALGIANTITTVSILFIAILAHKGFESFALVMGLHRNSQTECQMKRILWAFTFVTPFSIVLASIVERFFQTQAANLLTSIFSAFAAGSFLYIGTLHSSHEHFHPACDPTKRYEKILTTIVGIVIMAIITIWV